MLGASAIAATVDEVDVARHAFPAMLKQEGAPPRGRFEGLAVLQPVKDFPQRAASSLLAFEAAAEACRRAMAERTSLAGVV